MKITEMRLMSDEELKEIAKEKGRNGNASTKAKMAQNILWERNGAPFNSGLSIDPYGSKRFISAAEEEEWGSIRNK